MTITFFAVGLCALILVSAGFLKARRSLAAEAARAYAVRSAENTLPQGADEASFRAAWERAHAPRSLGYGAVALGALIVGIPVLLTAITALWNWAWVTFQLPEAVEPGSIIQGFFTAVFVVAGLVGLVAWPLALRYHTRRPSRFERELEAELANRAQAHSTGS